MSKKILSFLLTLIVIFGLLSITSCGEKNREYDETEVFEAAKKLIPKSVVMNELFYGYGISADLSSLKFNGVYYEADFISQNKFGIESVEEMKTLVKECFSSDYSDLIISTKLSSILDENGTPIALVRYYQDPTDTEIIMVNKDAEIYLKDNLEYLYDTLTVVESRGQEVFVKLDVKIVTDDKKEQIRTIEVALIEENGEWKINSPTYTTYFDNDKYDDLQNKITK